MRRRSLVLGSCLCLSLCLAPGAPARAAPGYPFAEPGRQDLAARVPPPPGARRVELPEGGFGAWLRRLPLLPEGAPVLLYDGTRKGRQDVHAAVVDLDVGRRDLQQCADAIMRLRAEYLFASGQPRRIQFHPEPGKKKVLAYTGRGDDRAALARFLIRVFSEAGTASLQAEMARVKEGAQALAPGDVLIQGGYPGHGVLVLDAAVGANGRRYVLLGQSFMPAQQFHVLKNLADPSLSPWFDAATLDSAAGLKTPEWRPFQQKDIRRFAD